MGKDRMADSAAQNPALCALLPISVTPLYYIVLKSSQAERIFPQLEQKFTGRNKENGVGFDPEADSATEFSADFADGRGWVFTGGSRGSRVILPIRSFRSFTEGNKGNEDRFSSHITCFVLLVTFCSIF